MKRFTKFTVCLLVAFLFVGLLASCGGDQGGNQGGNTGGGGDQKTKYTLTVWGSQEDQAMLKEMCAAYAAANPQNEYKFLWVTDFPMYEWKKKIPSWRIFGGVQIFRFKP